MLTLGDTGWGTRGGGLSCVNTGGHGVGDYLVLTLGDTGWGTILC